MEIYHLGLTMFARQLTGEGAKLFGGRWNLVGHPCIYAAGSKALCVLEYAANVLKNEIPDNLSFTTYDLPDDGWVSFSEKDLPVNWSEKPVPASTKEWGTRQLQNHLALRLPSIIIPTEYNFVVNPLHPQFKNVRITEVTPFSFDQRIKQ